jgi:PAS domain S-box-containing protein
MDLRLDAANPNLTRLLDAVQMALFTIDAEGRIAGWSQGATRVTGYEAEARLGIELPLLDAEEPGLSLASLWEEIRQGADFAEGMVSLRLPDGHSAYMLGDLRRLEEGGVFAGAVGVLTDLTLHVRANTLQSQFHSPERNRRVFQNMVGESPAMETVFERIEQAASIDVTVLLRGETGTGKELAARAIHALSERKGSPLVSVNCSAIPDPLLESELFGHVKGAFTGAVRDKRGVFEEAQGGILFLDEIGDLGPSVQVKLLRALQEREIRRVGGERRIKVDVRIVSATHRDLAAMVAAGEFREDLYYRLKVFELYMPPLRQRPADLAPLAEHFVKEFAARHRRGVVGLESDAQERIDAYPWPGNVRELRNAIEQAFVTVKGPRLRASDLPPEVQGAPPSSAAPAAGEADDERARIVSALTQTGGRKAAAARLLGVSRVTLWKRMKRLGISPNYGA